MRIAIVHNEYINRGGEDTVLDNEAALLRERGHEVTVAKVSNRDIHGIAGRIRTALYTAASPFGREWMGGVIAETRPDIVHVHNFFPLLSPAIYRVCGDNGVPVVQTLHNYRTICANAMLMRESKPCELCIAGSPYQGVIHRCYRDSALASIPLAHMIARHRAAQTWRRDVNRIVTLTEFARSRFLAAGFPADKVVVKPNFVADPGLPVPNRREMKHVLFVGRLTPEKGIENLMRAWAELEVPLRVAGDGPLRGVVDACASPHVSALGWKTSAEVAAEMRAARFLVMPSEWYEGFPMTLVEAFSLGLPVLVSKLGSMAEVVEDGVTGLHVNPGDPADWAAKVRWAYDNAEAMQAMGERARALYEERYTAARNYPMLMEIYAAAAADCAASAAARV